MWSVAVALPSEIPAIDGNNRSGLFLESDVLFNASIRGLRAFGGLLTRVDTRKETTAAKARLAELDVKYSDLHQPVMTLSGGNQQKVVLARWFLQDPDVYVLDEPTRGLDVTTKAEILRLISELAAEGRAILLINSDLDELVDHSHRFVVMREGRVVAKLGGDASREQLMVAAAGGLNGGGSQ